MRTPILILGLVLAMSTGALAQSVGVASAVNQSAVGLAPGKAAKTVYLGDEIIHNQKITTNGKGLLQILLVDGTSFTVGPNSSLTINSFVYDPDKGTAKVVASIGTGVFRFIGGATSKTPDGATINTPVGTVGILGGISNLDFSGAVAYHIDMVYGDSITLKDGTKIVGDLNHSGYSIVIGANGKINVEKTPPEWSQLFQAALTGNGKGGNVTGGQVKSNLGGTNNTNTNDNSDNSTPGETQIASNPSPIPTWAEIDNAGNVSSTATYNGKYSATVTPRDDVFVNWLTVSSPVPTHPDWPIFRHNRSAVRSRLPFCDRERDCLVCGTLQFWRSGTRHERAGKFANWSGDLQRAPRRRFTWRQTDYLGQVTGNINGFFYNTTGIGTATLGTFDAHVLNGEDGAYDMKGAFGGSVH